MPELDYVRSYSKPGESAVFVSFKEDVRAPRRARTSWYQVRKKIGDIRAHAAAGRAGRSSTTSSAIPSATSTRFTGDGFSYAQLKEHADRHARAAAARAGRGQGRAGRRAAGEASTSSSPTPSSRTLRRRARGGVRRRCSSRTRWPRAARFETRTDRIHVARRAARSIRSRASGAIAIRAGGRTFRLGDVADRRPRLRRSAAAAHALQGPRGARLGVSMAQGGDIIALGEALDARSRASKQTCRWAWSSSRSTTSRERCSGRWREFMRALTEARARSCWLVSFLSLGLRAGPGRGALDPAGAGVTFFFMY